MEHLYQDLNKVTGQETAESIHLTDFPQADESNIDVNLEEDEIGSNHFFFDSLYQKEGKDQSASAID